MFQNPKLQIGFWSVLDSGCLTAEVCADIPRSRPCGIWKTCGPRHFRGVVYCTAVSWTQLGCREGNKDLALPGTTSSLLSLGDGWSMSQARRRARNVPDSVVNCVTSNSACSTRVSGSNRIWALSSTEQRFCS